MNKEKLLDNRGRPLTQALFLELGYRTEFAQYTLKDFDHEYEGVVYPSLKRLYLEMEDPTEYLFAQEHLLGWTHWQRICNNKALSKEIEQWRYELELKLRAKAVQGIIEMSEDEKGFQAAKFIATKGWETRGAGRPSKAEVERERKIQADIESEYSADIVRLNV